ncbi:MAG: nucleotidyltransferase domain-containing protein [Acidobacteria bacterium]|nr:nucleotidyltransferase domain-containing protein [Acidobacteriota bacterium]
MGARIGRAASGSDALVDGLIHLSLEAHPTTQAIYRYGTWATAAHRPDSDLDIAVLLPYGEAMRVDRWQWHLLAVRLAGAAGTEHVDLVNLRRADTTLQAEILRTGRLVYCQDDGVRLEFETLVLSMYQRLNDERAGIRAAIVESARAPAP